MTRIIITFLALLSLGCTNPLGDIGFSDDHLPGLTLTPPTATLSTATTELTKNVSGTGTFTITLSGAYHKPVNVTTNFTGTATYGTDFSTTPAQTNGGYTFSVGETSKVITINAIDNLSAAGHEILNIALADSDTATIETPQMATIDVYGPSIDLNFNALFNDGGDFATKEAPYNTLTYNRTSVGTFIDADGIIKTAAAGVPRFNHDPLTGQPLGYLVEISSIQRLPYTEDFTTTWTRTNIKAFGAGSVANSTAVRAPDNTLSAEYIEEDSTAASHHELVYATAQASNARSIFSVFAKANGRTAIEMVVERAASTGEYISVICPLDGSAVTTSTGSPGLIHSSSVQKFRNDWYRCQVGGIVNSGQTTVTNLRIRLLDNTNNNTYNGTGTGGVYLWGANLVTSTNNSAHSSYIASHGTAGGETRAADNAVVSDISGFYNTAGGTLLTDFIMDGLSVDSGNLLHQTVFGFDDNTTNERLYVVPRDNNSNTGYIHTRIGNVAAPSSPIANNFTSIHVSYRIAATVAFNNCSSSSGGAAVVSDNGFTMTTNLTRMRMGHRVATTYGLKGSIGRAMYMSKHVPAATLQAWSATNAYIRQITPSVRLAQATLAATESSGPTSFIIGINEKISSPVTVHYALTGTATYAVDYTSASAISGTITFAPGEMRKVITVQPTSDGVPEAGGETVILTLSAPTNATLGTVPVSTLTISD